MSFMVIRLSNWFSKHAEGELFPTARGVADDASDDLFDLLKTGRFVTLARVESKILLVEDLEVEVHTVATFMADAESDRLELPRTSWCRHTADDSAPP